MDFIQGSAILVEGIFDMINLHDKGLTNAVCCFGTNNYNEAKLSMLQYKEQNTLKSFLMETMRDKVPQKNKD